MRSFAVWYKEKNQQANTSPQGVDAEVHINLWEQNICEDENSLVHIDIGLLVEDLTNVAGIYIYCPFKTTRGHVKDLGQSIIDNPKLVGAIFNENYQVTSGFARRLLLEEY